MNRRILFAAAACVVPLGVVHAAQPNSGVTLAQYAPSYGYGGYGYGYGSAPGYGYRSSSKAGHSGTAKDSPQATQESSGEGENVHISRMTFNPGAVRVKAGSTVTWTQRDGVPHTVTASGSSAAFNSGTMGVGQTFSHTFDKPGVYDYHCSVHPGMTGKVVVE